MYQLNYARIELQCDRCPARTSFSAASVSGCKFQARDDGWKLGKVENGRGLALCPSCASRSRKDGQ